MSASAASVFGPTTDIRERRLTYRLKNHWESLSRGRLFPSRADIDPEALREIWPWCFVLDAANSKEAPKFQHLGHELAAYSHVFLVISRDALPNSTLFDRATECWPQVVRGRKPIFQEEEITRFDRKRVLFRTAAFPLSDDQISINFVVGAASCKLVDPAG
jgi:hypothetical protein